MLVKLSILAQASGSAGGYTFSRGRSGAYVRNRSIPTNPGSEDQVTVRGIFASLSSGWAGLTSAQQNAWSTYAANVSVTNRLGDQIFLTGQQMFIRNNAARLRIGLAQVNDGPTTMSGASLTPPVTTLTPLSSMSIVFDANDQWVGETGAGLGVYCSTDKGSAINFHKGPYLFAGTILGDSTTPPTSPDTSVSSPYVHTTANHVFFRYIVCLLDGRISPVIRQGPSVVSA